MLVSTNRCQASEGFVLDGAFLQKWSREPVMDSVNRRSPRSPRRPGTPARAPGVVPPAHSVGASCDGGYAEMMLARATGLVSIPDELGSEEAAPILCAGLAKFNALRKCGAEAGDIVAVLGIGGLGHMALQYARRMGFKVVAVGRGQHIAEDAV